MSGVGIAGAKRKPVPSGLSRPPGNTARANFEQPVYHGAGYSPPIGTVRKKMPGGEVGSPAGHRREKRDRLAGRYGRIQPILEPDVFFVHEHVEEAPKLTVLVEQARFEVGV